MKEATPRKSCALDRNNDGTYRLTISENGRPILSQPSLPFNLALELINNFMYGEELHGDD